MLEMFPEDEVDNDDVGVVREDVHDELVEVVEEKEDVVKETVDDDELLDEDVVVVEVCEVEVELLLMVLVLEMVELVDVTASSW